MSTEKQKAANQENAKKSQGPTSEAGLNAIKLNAWRHGMAVLHHESFAFLFDENPEKFAELLKSLRDEHKPETETESILVRHMAESEWLRARAIRLQAYCVETGVNCKEVDKLPLFLRYQITHERAFHKSLNELRKLRNERAEAQIGIESQEREQAAEIRAAEAQNLRREALIFRKEELNFKKDVFQTRNAAAPSPETLQKAA